MPLALRGPSCGQDFDFHLLSWLEAAHDWRQAHFSLHWLETANYGAGEPRFVFYPPLSWALGALLGIAAGWQLAPLLLTFLAILAAGVCVYALALRFAARTPATIAACLFVANPYLLFVAYERSAYGELLATAPMALLLLFALSERIPVPATALAVAALWLTNAPSAVMGCYALAFVALLRAIQQRRWALASCAAAGCALGTALAGFYLVPAAWEQRWVQIGRAIGPGMRVEDSFLFGRTGEAYHDQVLRTASVIGVVLFSLGISGLCAAWLRGRRDATLGILGALLLALLLLQFPVSAPFWHLLPRLAFLQFPWRWLVVVGIAAVCAIAAALPRARRWQLGVAALIVAASIWDCSRAFYQPCDDEDAVSAQLAFFHDGSGVEGTDEYTAGKADNGAIQQHLPQARLLTSPDGDAADSSSGENPGWISQMRDRSPGKVSVLVWQPETRRISITTRQPAFAVLRLMDYPAWNIEVNGKPTGDRPAREDGLMVVPLAAGTSSIVVTWKTTADARWGRALSLAALLALFLTSRGKRGSFDSATLR